MIGGLTCCASMMCPCGGCGKRRCSARRYVMPELLLNCCCCWCWCCCLLSPLLRFGKPVLMEQHALPLRYSNTYYIMVIPFIYLRGVVSVGRNRSVWRHASLHGHAHHLTQASIRWTRSRMVPTSSIEETAFEALERDVADVLSRLEAGASMERFRSEYNRLFVFLKREKESRKELHGHLEETKTSLSNAEEMLEKATRREEDMAEEITTLRNQISLLEQRLSDRARQMEELEVVNSSSLSDLDDAKEQIRAYNTEEGATKVEVAISDISGKPAAKDDAFANANANDTCIGTAASPKEAQQIEISEAQSRWPETHCRIRPPPPPPRHYLPDNDEGRKLLERLKFAVETSKTKPRCWLCGHIHEGRGASREIFAPNGDKCDDTTLVINAANANVGKAHRLVSGAVLLNIERESSLKDEGDDTASFDSIVAKTPLEAKDLGLKAANVRPGVRRRKGVGNLRNKT